MENTGSSNQTAVVRSHLPLVAILRGLEPESALDVVQVLVDAGFGMIEVPLNSPRPLESIEAIVARFGDHALIGAGTVLTVESVDALHDIGARLVVSPNFSHDVVARAVAHGMVAMPGVLTPTDMFAAHRCGAAGLKIFPAELYSPSAVKAVRAVLPPDLPIFMVGGINANNMADYLAAGATGFGLGSALFRPGKSLADIASDAKAAVAGLNLAKSSLAG